MTQFVKVPKERIAVIIGPSGSVKKQIEEAAKLKLEINSDDGRVEIKDEEDPVAGMRAMEVIKAIARGFSPEKAMELFYEDFLTLDIIDLSEAASTPKELARLKGRIIGREGKTREIAERLINVKISVYGKTVSVIGFPEQTTIIRTAVDMLINGVNHGTVYSFLEKKHDDLIRAQMDSIEYIENEEE
ncbi:KH domain-containing protein [Methanimicrococcus blatticola]|uniref:Ribosomal RNA assembly protein n=1 Tax=Methanimicrococcus blatticola TaxID=91560 RepID=A0A484F687_9EURY|nr:KH domain-containing protein [Methanimicrococcus blatticola]MBZ3935878.1 KH domain-containing protein [Methanimicrococcus blatticola]MCC2508001.1 KH domain-containing protein [Methanimicrococcus blatticola]TDQ68915.1 ribosomal RNA assembly protein [Methanimicrococcus blatticola]